MIWINNMRLNTNISLMFLVVILIFSITTANANDHAKIKLINGQDAEIGLHDKLYFNGCGANPKKYSLEPKIVNGNIYEVANEVTKVAKSSYDRPVITKASSKLSYLGKNFTATLDNFRDLVIYNENGEKVHERKINGASSLYEIKNKGKIIAWGVGWHNYCEHFNNGDDNYEEVDFTAFRIFLPWSDDKNAANKILFTDHLFNGVSQNKYSKIISDSDDFILVATDNIIIGGLTFYYYTPKFFKFNNGAPVQITSIKDFEENKINWKKITPINLVVTLLENNQNKELIKYLKENLSLVFEEIQPHMKRIDQVCEEKFLNTKAACMQFLESSPDASVTEIEEKCFQHLPDGCSSIYFKMPN